MFVIGILPLGLGRQGMEVDNGIESLILVISLDKKKPRKVLRMCNNRLLQHINYENRLLYLEYFRLKEL